MANPIKIQASVSKIIQHDSKIFTVVFQPEKRIPRFKAGQFLHLALDEYDQCGGYWPDSRVFSIASSCTSKEISIIYSVKGKFTIRMRDELCLGKMVWLKLPYGAFSIDHNAKKRQDVVLVAGGTGISPFISYLETAMFNNIERKIHLIYGIRRTEHLVFEELLKNCNNKIDGFSMNLFLEEESDGVIPFNSETQISGIITTSSILNNYYKMSDPIVFLSGPPTMILFFKQELIDNGIPENVIVVDEWE